MRVEYAIIFPNHILFSRGIIMLNVTWHGHACFELNSDAGRIVFDPYEENYLPGLKMPHLTADAVISSHRHGDHYAPDMVALTGNEPDATVTQIPCFHDEVQGKKRGNNLISVVEIEGRRICHMGDIGHMLSDAQLELMDSIDVLMIPVGGLYTVDAETAKAICEMVKPRVIVPMHFKAEGKGLQNVAPVSDFISLFPEDDVCFLERNTVSIEELLNCKIAVFPWP